MVWCDNRCRDKALRFWQFASVDVDDVKDLHGQFVSVMLSRKIAVEGSRGKEGASWQTMENVGKIPVYTRNVGVFLSLARAKAKTFLRDAEKEKQEGIQGQWQQESSVAEEFLEQVKSSADTYSTLQMMRCG